MMWALVACGAWVERDSKWVWAESRNSWPHSTETDFFGFRGVI